MPPSLPSHICPRLPTPKFLAKPAKFIYDILSHNVWKPLVCRNPALFTCGQAEADDAKRSVCG